MERCPKQSEANSAHVKTLQEHELKSDVRLGSVDGWTVKQVTDFFRHKKIGTSETCPDVVELLSGLEPPTYALPRRCATYCATAAFLTDECYFTTFFANCKVFFLFFSSIAKFLLVPFL